MMPWALVLAADMAAGFTLEPNNLRRNEMVGDGSNLTITCTCRLSEMMHENGWIYVSFDCSVSLISDL